MAKAKNDPNQIDMFYEPAYPVRVAEPMIDQERFHSEIARACSRAMDDCEFDRHEIALQMAKALGQDDFSKAMLDAYASESKDTHNISMVRFMALIMVTKQYWLLDMLAKKIGALVLVGDEPILAEQANLERKKKAIEEKLSALKKTPIKIKRRANR